MYGSPSSASRKENRTLRAKSDDLDHSLNPDRKNRVATQIPPTWLSITAEIDEFLVWTSPLIPSSVVSCWA